MIAVRGLTKLYGSLVAVEDLSFEVAPGEVLGLVGPNGAGKTTTLRTLVGIVRPTRGTISIGGRDLDRDPVGAKRHLAFMPDEPRLFDYLTVEEHLRFTGRLYGVRDADARIPALLRELELAEKAGALPDELSRGMKQKLAIACGLLHEPKALLFDAPPVGPAAPAEIPDRLRRGVAVLLLADRAAARAQWQRRATRVRQRGAGDPAARHDSRDELAVRELPQPVRLHAGRDALPVHRPAHATAGAGLQTAALAAPSAPLLPDLGAPLLRGTFHRDADRARARPVAGVLHAADALRGGRAGAAEFGGARRHRRAAAVGGDRRPGGARGRRRLEPAPGAAGIASGLRGGPGGGPRRARRGPPPGRARSHRVAAGGARPPAAGARSRGVRGAAPGGVPHRRPALRLAGALVAGLRG